MCLLLGKTVKRSGDGVPLGQRYGRLKGGCSQNWPPYKIRGFFMTAHGPPAHEQSLLSRIRRQRKKARPRYSQRRVFIGSIRTASNTAGSEANSAAAKRISAGSISMATSVAFT